MAQTVLIYGESGTGKTADIGGGALYVYEKTGLPTYLVNADSGGWQSVQGFVDAGLIIPIALGGIASPSASIRKISRGMWPQVEGGDKWGYKQLDLSKVGAIAIDSLSGLSSIIMREQITAGRKIGEDVVSKFDLEGESFGNAGRAHYGFVQNEIISVIQAMAGLNISRVFFTALEAKGDDQMTKQLVYGPATMGKATVDKIPALVGDLLHYDIKTSSDVKTGKTSTVFRSWFRPHPDPQTNVNYPAKPRLQKEVMGKLLERYPEGYFIRGMELTEGGLYKYLKDIDDLRLSPTEEIKAAMKRADELRSNNITTSQQQQELTLEDIKKNI